MQPYFTLNVLLYDDTGYSVFVMTLLVLISVILLQFENDEYSIDTMLQAVNPFSPTLFLIVAKISLPKCSVPYW